MGVEYGVIWGGAIVVAALLIIVVGAWKDTRR